MKKTILFTFGLVLLALMNFLGVSPASAASCDASLLRQSTMGQRGAHIKALQDCLIMRGYNINGGASGYYGVNTRKAVVDFYKNELQINNWNGRSFGPRARAVLATGNVVTVTPPSVANAPVGLKLLASKEELQSYLELSNVSGIYRRVGSGGIAIDAVLAPQMSESNTSSAGALPDRVSTTNVQVAGIDEPDTVKTDGNTIYFSRQQNYYALPMARCLEGIGCGGSIVPPVSDQSGVTAINAFPLSSLGIASNTIPERGEMLLSKDKKVLIIFTYNQIVAYDISSPAKPVKKWTNDLKDNTNIVTARMMDDTMYVVTSTYLNSGSPCPVMPMQRGVNLISIPCTNIWAPKVPEASNTVYTMFKMNPSTGVETNSLTVLGDSGSTTVSMFGESLYIAYRTQSNYDLINLEFYKSGLGDLLSQKTRDRINEVSNLNISTQSKLQEINIAIDKEMSASTDSDRLKKQTDIQNKLTDYMNMHLRDTDRSTIVKVALSNLAIAGTVSIPGHVLNQFSMDEYNGNLRVATTVGETWSGKSMNDIYVIDKNMNTVGSVTDLGLTERIYSVRFIGDKAYVVTFRQTDPFYVLDLSQPTAPKMVGELKIPGYSAYLEPLSANTVLGVGREGSQVKMSLFDVTDPKNPIERSKYTLDEYWTDVENNHHAFLRDAKHNVFFVPGGKGGYVISYLGNTLSLKATVAGNQISRAVTIDDFMYFIGQDQITVLDENSWKEVKTLKLP